MSRHVEYNPPIFYRSIYQAYEDGIQPSPDEVQAFEQAALHKRQQLNSRGAAAASPSRRCLLFLGNCAPEECLDVSSGLKLRPPVPRPRVALPQEQHRPKQQVAQLTFRAAGTSSKCSPPADPYPPTTVTLRSFERNGRRNAPRPGDLVANGTSDALPQSPHQEFPTVLLPAKLGTAGAKLSEDKLTASASAPATTADPVAAVRTPAPNAASIVSDSSVTPCRQADAATAAPVAPAPFVGRPNGEMRPPLSPVQPASLPPDGVGEPCMSPRLQIDETINRITMRELPGDGTDLFGLSFSKRLQFCWRFYLLPAPPGGSWQCFAELALRSISNEELTMVDSFATRYACPAPEVILYHWQHLWQTERSHLCLLPPSCSSVRHILDELGRADLAELLPPPTIQ